ncbi:MAG: hypothetical protein ACPG4T_22855 [Nannocystaceae bacterium]
MRRIHAFEFHERSECPVVIRESIVETLGRGLRWGRVYDDVGERFADFCERARCDTVLDLCSGSGEPVAILLDALVRKGIEPPRFITSDLFPNLAAMNRVARQWPGKITVKTDPVDATAVPADLPHQARTVISAFHHFPPQLAARMLADAVANRQAIFIVEPCPRRFSRFAAMVPILALSMYINPLLAGSKRLLKSLLTYGVPVVPALGLWDGLISTMRMYNRSELKQMTSELGGGYRWQFHEVPFFPGGLATVFEGIPAVRPA